MSRGKWYLPSLLLRRALILSWPRRVGVGASISAAQLSDEIDAAPLEAYRDAEDALELLSESSSLAFPDERPCRGSTWRLLRGIWFDYVKGDVARATQEYEIACSIAPCPMAQNNLGVFREKAGDLEGAERLYSAAAGAGHATAAANLAALRVERGENAIAQLTETAEVEGLAQAQYLVGWCWEGGRGGAERKDGGEAERWYKMAAGQGHTAALVALGRMAEARGHGDVAAEMFDLPARRGDATAQFFLSCIKDREGDPFEAAVLLDLAARQGHAQAANNLGLCHLKGAGVPVDREAAFRLFTVSHEKGCASGTANLALCLLKGTGVPPDQTRAVSLLTEAASKGHSGAARVLSFLNTTPPPKPT